MADLTVAVQIVATDNASPSLRAFSVSLQSAGTAANSATSPLKQAAQGVDTFDHSAQQATSHTSELGKSFKETATSAAELAAGFAGFQGIESALENVKESAIDFNAHLQQSQVAWTTFLGSASAASSEINQLKTFSSVTPFRFEGLEDDARLLDAMGVSANKVMPLLTDIGNAVSATGRGAEGMQRVAYTMGEIQSLGQVDDRTLRQLTIDGGIPAFEMLAQAMGKSTQEIRKMASEGKISADQFMTIFHNFVSQNWGDMMAKQAQTFNGAFSTLQDNLQIAIADATKPAFDRLAADMADAAKSSMNFGVAAKGVASILNDILTTLDKVDPKVIEVAASALAAATAVRVLGNAAIVAVPSLLALRDATIFTNITTALTGMSAELAELSALEGATVGLSGVLGVIGTELVAMLGPVGLVAAGVGAFAIAYETNLFHTRDVTDEVVARVVDDASIWVEALGRVADATSKIQMPSVAGVSLPQIQVPDFATDIGKKAGLLGLAGIFGPLGIEVLAVDQATQKLGASIGHTSGQAGGLTDSLRATYNEFENLDAAMVDTSEAAKTAGDSLAYTADQAKEASQLLGGVNAWIEAQVQQTEAYQSAASAVTDLQGRVDSLKAAQEANSAATAHAQDVLRGEQDQVSSLSDALSTAKQRLTDLSNVHLAGMNAVDEREFALTQQINANKLEQIQLEERIAQAQGRQTPRTPGIYEIPASQVGKQAKTPDEIALEKAKAQGDEFQRQLEITQLQAGLKYDPQLRNLKQVADGVPPELTYDQAAKQIKDTKDQVKSLEGQLKTAKDAAKAQEDRIRALESAGKDYSAQLKDTQDQLQLAEDHQKKVNDAYNDALTYLLDLDPKLRALGPAGNAAADQLSDSAKQLINGVSLLGDQTNKEVNKTLDDMIAKFKEAESREAAIATGLTTATPASARRGDQGRVLTPDGARASGGPVLAGHVYLVGENGPEPFIPATNGYILPNRSVAMSAPMMPPSSGGRTVSFNGPLIGQVVVRNDADLEDLKNLVANLPDTITAMLENDARSALGQGSYSPVGIQVSY